MDKEPLIELTIPTMPLIPVKEEKPETQQRGVAVLEDGEWDENQLLGGECDGTL